MVPVSDRPPGANRLGRWVDHLPRFKNQGQSVLTLVEENPVEEKVEVVVCTVCTLYDVCMHVQYMG